MSKTLTLNDVQRDAREAKRIAQEEARMVARFHVIQAKRKLHDSAKAFAYVDGKLHDGGADARSDLAVQPAHSD